LATLASVSAFAQTTVTLSGNLDFAAANFAGSQTGAKGSTITTTSGVSSTSVINLDAIEDIGGGNKVQVHYGLDPRTLANDAFAVNNNQINSTTAASPIAGTNTGLSRDELYVSIESASLGKLMLGAPNSLGLDTHGVASPLGTGVGSGFAPASKTMTSAIVFARYDRSVRFNSAAMNGFSVQANYAPGADNAGLRSAAVSGTATGATAVGAGVANAALQMPNNRKVTEVGFSYANGPLNVRFTNISQGAQTYSTGWYGANGDGSLTAINLVSTKNNLISANYNLGAATLYYGYTNGDLMTSTDSSTKAVSTRMAGKYDMGQVVLTIQRTAQRETTSANVITDRSVTGMRADYVLSKTSKVYAGYENWNTGKLAVATDTTTGDRKITSVGLQKSF